MLPNPSNNRASSKILRSGRRSPSTAVRPEYIPAVTVVLLEGVEGNSTCGGACCTLFEGKYGKRTPGEADAILLGRVGGKRTPGDAGAILLEGEDGKRNRGILYSMEE